MRCPVAWTALPMSWPGNPVKQLTAWIEQMFALAHDPRLRMHLTVIDSDEVRAARGIGRPASACTLTGIARSRRFCGWSRCRCVSARRPRG